MRDEIAFFGAWRCQVVRADGTVRTSRVIADRDYERASDSADVARRWCEWMGGRLDGKPRIESGESVRLQFRAPGKSRYAVAEATW